MTLTYITFDHEGTIHKWITAELPLVIANTDPGHTHFEVDPDLYDSSTIGEKYIVINAELVALADIVPPPTAQEILDAKREQATVVKSVFCRNLMSAGILPPSEALQAMRGEWPPSFNAALVGLTDLQAAEIQFQWLEAENVRRNHPLIATLAALANISDTTVDALFDIT